MNKTIVVLDGYTLNPGDLSWGELERFGEVILYDRTEKADVAKRIENAEIVLTNKTIIDGEAMRKCEKLSYIGVLATGYDVVDVKAAKDLGITVSNVPQYGTESVSQFAIALLLEICNRVGQHSDATKQGKWSQNQDWCFWDYPIIGLNNKVMGVIGFGRIGQQTGKIARALGMQVLYYDNYTEVEGTVEVRKVDQLDDLLSLSDVVVLHCPLTEETQEIINKNTLKRMKATAILINNSRGPLINDVDLAEALSEQQIYAAGIDVVSVEPISEENPLLNCTNCFITPHISWASKAARERIMKCTGENIAAYLSGDPMNVVS
ncbi:D-2-hydroxyacid dehydrogenase [Candidatus Enterococcus ferrettii]|uniref:Glycerate dehydrogenase n=1 Tax=Candidatus Enterococcus ferrettii TaxID=2815324 RepID=A0ABV0EPM0_9ENTE|nr:D-2-hydroxyacid dehydrogenase [Enterococcus sp. 665A]MBO1338902.1 D-2-hydroxyacid dehydrogenase [Enterococcus sp. 665A]